MKHFITLKNWQKLKIWWKALVIVDWGNIYKTYCEHIWIKLFKDSYDFLIKILEKITNNFSSEKIKKENIFVFVGIDENIKSSVIFAKKLKEFLWEGNVITKPVKFLKDKNWNIKRKADFDGLIWYFVCKKEKDFRSFIFLSSDGDFADIYKSLLENNKQIIVFHWITFEEKTYIKNWLKKKKKKKKYNLGKEVWELAKKYKWKILNYPLDKLI